MVKLCMMSPRKRKSGQSSAGLLIQHPQIQRYFEISLFLLTLTGFATLAGTGKIDVISLVLVTGALAGRALLLFHRRQVAIPERITNYVTLLYIAFYGLDYLFISRQFIPATVHLVLFSLMVKSFSVHRDRDYLYIAVLSFAMVLATAVLTVDSLFLFLFGVFLLIALATATSTELRRSWADSQGEDQFKGLDVAKLNRTAISAPLVRMTLALAGAILFFAVGIFFLLPRRMTAGYLSSLGSQSELVSGFRDEVQLGAIGRIQQSNAVVMHVSFLPGARPPADFRLRGVALSRFEGNRWSNTREHYILPGTGTGFRIPRLTIHNPADHSRNIRYQVSFDSDSQVIFLIPDPVVFFGTFRLLRVDASGSVFINYLNQETRKYVAESHPPAPMSAAIEHSNTDYPGPISEDLQLPLNIDRRIRNLAEQITAKQPTRFRKAQAIEQYLLKHYDYTLELPNPLPADPLAHFLFERKKGHCEYFATAMAIMLRTIGLPARVVNGFRGGEYNDITGSYMIRAKDAHSWVEAYFTDYGWYTFDPTPGGNEAPLTGWSRIWLYTDAMREFWQEWVINYDFAHQSILSFRFAREGQADFSRVQEWSRNQYDRWILRLERLKSSLSTRPRGWALWLVSIVLSILVLTRVAALLRAIRRFRIARRPEKAPQSAATIWYMRLLKLLSRHGYRKNPAHTPGQFVDSLQTSTLSDPVRRFTESYERARFGESSEDAARLPKLYEEVDSASRK